MLNFTFIVTFFFSRNTRIKKSIKLFNAFFGVFKIKGTGFKSLLILYRLSKALSSYMPVPTFLLKAGTGVIFNGTVTAGAASRIRIVIAGVLKVKRLILCRGEI